MKLEGKVAIVTGAGRGIGFGCAKRMAMEGAKVVVAEDDEELGSAAENALRDKGADVRFVGCDVGDPQAIADMISETLESFGAIDICVNNAGISRRNHFFEVSEEEFDTIMRVNLKGVFLVTQAVAREMVRSGTQGSIINMGSIVGTLSVPQQPVYCVSKQGVAGTTKVFALALADKGVRVNAIGPGTIHTEMSEKVHQHSDEWRRQVMSRTPLGRLGEPDDVARVAVFLASDDSAYITGQTIYVDGGRLPLNHAIADVAP